MLLILALWLWLYRGMFSYLGVIFTAAEFRTNQLVLVGVIVLIIMQIRAGGWRLGFAERPHVYLPGLSLALGGSILYLVVERFLDINTVSATLFGLASYGLLSLWLAPRRWRQGLPAALLLIGALPFGDHLQTFVGYPLRILTASIVRDGLAVAGVHSVGVDTILVFENGLTQIDLPCSGVKSLWSGGLFLIAAAWIERRALNVRWFLVAMGLTFFLFIANLLRVGMLVVLGQVAGWRLLAEILHVPLGVLGFIAACALAAVLLRQTQQAMPEETEKQIQARLLNTPWLTPTLMGALLAMGLAYSPRPTTVSQPSPAAWEFPGEIETEAWPLTPAEIEWVTRGGAEAVDRWRFTWRETQGSLLLVTSATWRAHHRPERCFEVYGLAVDGSQAIFVESDFPVRLLSLGSGGRRNLYTAVYWLQSTGGRVTEDYATRIWADLTPERERWVLVTVLFDRELDASTAEMAEFFTGLRLAVQRGLEGDD